MVLGVAAFASQAGTLDALELERVDEVEASEGLVEVGVLGQTVLAEGGEGGGRGTVADGRHGGARGVVVRWLVMPVLVASQGLLRSMRCASGFWDVELDILLVVDGQLTESLRG